uniref:Uncharacterized protein n=1 Tax=Setaria italica TaxID=4555 RepID=K4AFI6_SETIT
MVKYKLCYSQFDTNQGFGLSPLSTAGRGESWPATPGSTPFVIAGTLYGWMCRAAAGDPAECCQLSNLDSRSTMSLRTRGVLLISSRAACGWIDTTGLSEQARRPSSHHASRAFSSGYDADWHADLDAWIGIMKLAAKEVQLFRCRPIDAAELPIRTACPKRVTRGR